MLNIKNIIVKYLIKITLIIVSVILMVAIFVQILNEQYHAREDSASMFYQIEQILTENQQELTQIEMEYSQTCLYNAEAIAYIIQNQPSVLEDIEELRKIAEFMEVDEIHIFNTTGEIFMGTHPEFYGYTFDSGEQIGFFKPMLEDKSLQLCQEITPNTAQNKLMQYSALWSENGEFIVQIGMEPINVMKVTEKNELSHIFSLLRFNPGVTLYAIDAESGEIMGSTDLDDVGKNLTEIGFDLSDVKERGSGFHAKVKGVGSYCIFTTLGTNLIGRIISNDVLYDRIFSSETGLAICLIFIAFILVFAVTGHINKFVIKGIYDINKKLRAITDGNLDEKVNVQTSLEFSELSSHINEMINSLLASTDKISYILNKTNMNIGVYEYNEHMKKVRFTEYIPKILSLDTDQTKQLSSDYKLFKDYIDKLREHPVPEEIGTFCLNGEKEIYVKLEDIINNNDILGIVMDVTEEITKRKQLEAERDRDLLTGLYNRSGLERKLSQLFAEPDKLGFGALIMIDADGLKGINDKYGHEMGDIYIKKISEVITSVGPNSCISARQGGDEFVLFLYHYKSEEELLKVIDTLKYIQNNSIAHLCNDLSVPLKFSFGFSMTKGRTDYSNLLKEADEKMYTSKRERKKDCCSDLN